MKSPRASIFAKLTLTAMLAAAASALAISAFIGEVFDEARDHHAARLRALGRLAIEGMLADSSPSSLARIAAETGVEIRYRDGDGEFATDPRMPAFSEMRRDSHHRRGRKRRRFESDGGEYRGASRRRGGEFFHAHPRRGARDHDSNFYFIYRSGERAALIGAPHGGVWDRWPGLVAALGLALAAIWGAAYFCIRRLLSPLAALRDGMEAVGGGEWREFRSARKDEIGALARGFNRMQARLRKMIAARERFLIDASHELRSPIARLKLAAEFVGDGETRDRIAADLRELESLVDGILRNAKARSKRPGISPAALDVARWCEAALARRSPADRARLSLRFVDRPLFARADGGALGRALGNVWDNALRAAAGATTVVEEKNGGIEIAVEDDGPGVAAEDLPRLFEPFFRADPSRARDSGGFGLGLAIVAGIIEAHGGEARAENIPGGGLRVVLRLPAAEAPQTTARDSVK